MAARKCLLIVAIICSWTLVRSAPSLSAPAEKTPAAEAKADETITNSIGMKLVLIPAGEFQMGTIGDADDEKPHRVRITRPFYLGVYEVTQQEFEAVMGWNPSYFSANGGGKKLVDGTDTALFPVESVNWGDAVNFCRKLSEKENKSYRLPTEAEWEYACRAGTATAYHVGNSLTSDQARISSQQIGDAQLPAKVGSYRPNRFGIHDMHGNVWEWCSDWYGRKYYEKSPIDDPQGPESGLYHVDRGGCWVSFDETCRSANRRTKAADRFNILGFRVVLDVAAVDATVSNVKEKQDDRDTAGQSKP